MFDPFVASHPSVIVHEVGGHEFDDAWRGFDAAENALVCPVCHEGHPRNRGTSPATVRPWIEFSCGDYIAQEITAG